MPPLFTKGPFSSAEHKHPRDCFGSLFLFAPPAVIVYVNPSVNPPFGVLPAPRSGSLLVLPPTKSCPRLWGKWHEVPKGVRLKTAECRELFPLSFAYAQQNAGWNMVVLQRCRLQYSLFRPILPSLHRPLGALGSNPPHTVEPLGAVQTRRTVPYPFAERSFQWGYGGCRGA